MFRLQFNTRNELERVIECNSTNQLLQEVCCCCKERATDVCNRCTDHNKVSIRWLFGFGRATSTSSHVAADLMRMDRRAHLHVGRSLQYSSYGVVSYSTLLSVTVAELRRNGAERAKGRSLQSKESRVERRTTRFSHLVLCHSHSSSEPTGSSSRTHNNNNNTITIKDSDRSPTFRMGE